MNLLRIEILVFSIVVLALGGYLYRMPEVKPSPRGGFVDSEGKLYNIIPNIWGKIFMGMGLFLLVSVGVSFFIE